LAVTVANDRFPPFLSIAISVPVNIERTQRTAGKSACALFSHAQTKRAQASRVGIAMNGLPLFSGSAGVTSVTEYRKQTPQSERQFPPLVSGNYCMSTLLFLKSLISHIIQHTVSICSVL
jgi:hypothetical protein